jgi:hypothetical protein
MAGNARKKIDGHTQQLFDSEVEKPAHDEILMALYEEQRLEKLLAEIYGLAPLPPFTEDSKFHIQADEGPTRLVGSRGVLSLAEATEITKVPPQWKSPSRVRIQRKQLEYPLEYTASTSNYARLVGFIDLAVWFDVLDERPYVWAPPGVTPVWRNERQERLELFEVKSQWPSVGVLIRQLNLYRHADPRGGSHHRTRGYSVVGPDESVRAIVNEHGYSLTTFDAEAGGLAFCARAATKSFSKKPPDTL